ncbi:MAG: cytochrome P450 [Myxococcota bacterium]
MSSNSTHTRPNLGDPSILADPYPTYRQAFAHGALCSASDSRRRTWFVGGHATVSALLRDPRLSSNRVRYLSAHLSEPQRQVIAPLLGSLSRWLLFADPPQHTPVRRTINAALTRRLVMERRASIEAVAADLITAMLDAGEADVVSALAYPLPAIVIAEMLGARAEDREQLRAWSQDIGRFLGTVEPAAALDCQRSVVGMTDYFRDVLARHRQQPRPDLLGALLAHQRETPEFDDETLLANCVALVFAGHETTTNLIANAVHLLLERPSLVEHLSQTPSAWERTIDEVLRFESPVQRVSRRTTEAIEIEGTTVAAGDRVVMVLAAANRDPAVFDEPDVFDPTRHPNPHVGFGFGIHRCSGAALARLEARIALEGLVARSDQWRRLAPPEFLPNFGLRALRELPISLAAR